MYKSDYKKKFTYLYNPSLKDFSIVDVPVLKYLMIDGMGDPNTSREYSDAVEALFSVAYAAKFKVKKGETGIDFSVMPLEGLWWTPNMEYFSVDRKNEWCWSMMIMQPEIVTSSIVRDAIDEVRKKKNPKAISLVRYDEYREGRAAQILYRGPYAAESSTIARLHAFIKSIGCEPSGKHHEIYLNDMRRTSAEKLRTIIRQPMGLSRSNKKDIIS